MENDIKVKVVSIRDHENKLLGVEFDIDGELFFKASGDKLFTDVRNGRFPSPWKNIQKRKELFTKTIPSVIVDEVDDDMAFNF